MCQGVYRTEKSKDFSLNGVTKSIDFNDGLLLALILAEVSR
ncbi:hypothetical protein Pan161_59450 [Gimesia algae]|uniref:Uncharacterized protein n=1 Tax=Gimesia algae TaxID=2527971 RepID=A0A517VMW3_9PLAN|nr:hypothetical protein Pan161_59450 [Gimesia algae]